MHHAFTFFAPLYLVLNVSAATYHLDNTAPGPTYDGSAANPWKFIVQAQAYLNNLPDGGSGDSVLVHPGSGSYGDWVDGAYGSGFSDLQKQQVERSDWLVIKAADPADPPEFRWIQMYGSRNAYIEFNGLHVRSTLPYASTACIQGVRFLNHVRIIGIEIECEIDSAVHPVPGIWFSEGGAYMTDVLVEGCLLHQVADGIVSNSQNAVFRGNEIRNAAGSAVKAAGEGPMLVEYNHIHDQFIAWHYVNVYGTVDGSFRTGMPVTQDSTGARGTVSVVEADYVRVIPDNLLRHGFVAGQTVRARLDSGLVSGVTTVNGDGIHASGLSIRVKHGYTARGNRIHAYGGTHPICIYGDAEEFAYSDMLLENNLVYDPRIPGGTFDVSAIGIDEEVRNLVIRNNTFIGLFEANFTADGSELTLENNVIRNLMCKNGVEYGRIRENNNVVSYLGVSWDKVPAFSDTSTSLILEEDGYGASYFADALFEDYEDDDFRPAAGSPAIDFGKAADAPATDLNGFTRDGAPDAGCFEAGSVSGVSLRPFDSAQESNAEYGMHTPHRFPNPAGIRSLLLSGITHVRMLDGRMVDVNDICCGGVYLARRAGEMDWYRIIVH